MNMVIKEDTGLTILNPQDLTISSDKVKRDVPKYWTREYINQHIEKTKNYQHQMLLQFLWITGVRVSEVVSVQKQDIDIENYTIRIRWLKNRKFNYRNIPLHPRLRDLLRLYTANMKAEERIFPITRQAAWQVVRKHLKGHPHQFRHSFAVNWLQCGGDIVILSRMLGHTKIQTTMEYLKIVPIDQGRELLKVRFD